MAFSIDIQPISTFNNIRITNLLSRHYIDIVTKGGLLNSWMQSNDHWDIIDGMDLTNGWANYESNGFKSAKMSPFACRLFNGEYQHASQFYKIEKCYLGDHAIHGLLYDAEFEIIKTALQEKEATVILEHHYKGNDKGFPFEYSVQLHWTFFEDNKVSVQTVLSNKSSHSIPMMDGWHPYFKLGTTIDNCKLQFHNQGMLVYDAQLIPTGETIPQPIFENGVLLENIKLDNGYLLTPTQPQCTFQNENYVLTITPDEAYPYLQLYTPDHRKSIAIENISGAPDSFNNKIGLHIMQPQSIWRLKTSYQLLRK